MLMKITLLLAKQVVTIAKGAFCLYYVKCIFPKNEWPSLSRSSSLHDVVVQKMLHPLYPAEQWRPRQLRKCK